MTVFVILHYITIEETVTSIESILRLEPKDSIRVVVVDNASPNGSGMTLYNTYEKHERVKIVLSKDNIGFAKGNNLGCQVAIDSFSPEFIVIMNNDVLITQPDFVSQIEKEWLRKPFDVLGPDIYVPALSLHQSPKRTGGYTREEVEALLSGYTRKVDNNVLIRLKNVLKRLPGLRSLVLNYRKKRLGVEWSREYENVPLHGACVVMSRRFIDSRGYAFNPETFMYYEMEILDQECLVGGYREIYRPSLAVEHHHNISTKASFKSDFERVKFMDTCILHSLEVFLKTFE